MISNLINNILVVLVTIIVFICSIGIIIAIRFQNKKNKKYKEYLNIIKEKQDSTFSIKDGLTKEEISEIDDKVDVDLLMVELYNTYIELENKIKVFDNNLDNVLVGYLKDFYINKIDNFKEKGFSDVTDGIDLVNYSIIEYSKEKLKFRITINCFCYKTVNNQIVSGSNLEKIQEILLLSFEKANDKWLISSYEKIYEKKLGN